MPLKQTAVDALVKRLNENDPTLTALDLNPFKIYELNGDPVPRFLSTVANTPSWIGDREWEQLMSAIRHNKVLERLELSGSCIHSVGAQKLAEILPDNHSLKFIDLSDNEIGTEGIVALTNALLRNSHIQHINLFHNAYFDDDLLSEDPIDRAYIENQHSERAEAMIKLMEKMENTLQPMYIEFPSIWRARSETLEKLLHSMEKNLFVTYSEEASGRWIDFMKHPKLEKKAFAVMKRNDVIHIPLCILYKGIVSKEELHQYLPELPDPLPKDADIMRLVFERLIDRMKAQVSAIANDINKNDIIHNTYRLLYAQN